MNSLSRRFTAVLAALALVALAGCTTTADGDSEEITSVTVAVPSAPPWIPAQWSPAGAPTGVNTYFPVNQAVYENLFVLDRADFGFDPVLAEEFTISEDRRSMSLTLREGVVFTDGELLTAEAVKRTFEEVMSQPTYWSAVLAPYTPEVTVQGDHQLEIHTTRGIGFAFLTAVAILPIVSPAAWDDPSILAERPVGTGPYIVEDVAPEVSITMVRNPDYWNADAYDFDEITFVAFADRVAALNALKSGQVDVAAIDLSMVAEAESSGFEIRTGGGVVTTLVLMDPTGTLTPVLDDIRVRQAISMAFDREAIAETLDLGYGRASSQVFIPGHPSYIEGGDDRYPYDPERARELLAEAGYPDGFDLTIAAGVTRFDPIVEQYLGDIGIRVTIETIVPGTDQTTLVDFAMLLFPTGDQFWVQRLVTGTWAKGLPGDPEVIEIVDRVDNGDAETSAAASQELGEYILENGIYIPISRAADTWATIPEVTIDLGSITSTPPLLSSLRLVD